MMLVVFPFAWWQGEGPLIASAVGISLISITTLAATTGAILPLLFDRMKLDPALMSLLSLQPSLILLVYLFISVQQNGY